MYTNCRFYDECHSFIEKSPCRPSWTQLDSRCLRGVSAAELHSQRFLLHVLHVGFGRGGFRDSGGLPVKGYGNGCRQGERRCATGLLRTNAVALSDISGASPSGIKGIPVESEPEVQLVLSAGALAGRLKSRSAAMCYRASAH